MKYAKGFVLFWYDFLVGDSIALAIGGIAVLALAFALVEIEAETAAEFILPVAVIVTIWASLPRSRA